MRRKQRLLQEMHQTIDTHFVIGEAGIVNCKQESNSLGDTEKKTENELFFFGNVTDSKYSALQQGAFRRAANKVTNLVVALRSSRSTRTLPAGDVSWLQFIADVGTLRETADFERWEAWDDTFKPGAMIFTLDFLLNITAGAFDSIPTADRTHMHSTIFALIGLTERPCYPPWDEKKDYVGAPRWAEEVIDDVKKLMDMVEKMRADSSKTTSSPPPHKRRRIRSE
ncbi:hypothetical protein PRIPAC_87472 [Pristionchus pacificus]|nr:hypothetical protein PRIPAC_87472 [Pristionchus pacificus]